MNTKNFSRNYQKNIDKRQVRYYNKSNTNNKKYIKDLHNCFYNRYYIKNPNNTRKRKIYLSNKATKTYPINNEHDKMFRIALSNKKDAYKFIKSIINFKSEITENDLKLYKTNFVTSQFKNREADVIYKIKDKNIFILIEHQTKVDYSMPYRILEYQFEIMRNNVQHRKLNKKDAIYPAIIPIVLYAGKEKWNTKNSIRQLQDNDLVDLKELSSFYLVDVNKYKKKELLNNDILISKLMLLESAKTNEELAKYLEEIIPKIKEEDKGFIINVIDYILSQKIGNTKAKESIRKLSGGDEKMLACVEMLREEDKRNIRQGIKIGEARGITIGKKQGVSIGKKRGLKIGEERNKKEIAKKLLARNFSIEDIAEITGLKKQEIKNIKDVF